MKKTLITGFFLFLLFFWAVLIAIMLLISYHQSGVIMARLEDIGPVSLEQRLAYSGLTAQSESRFLAAGFYVFLTGFMAALFLGKRFFKAVNDLHQAARQINSGGLPESVQETPQGEPAPGAGELSEIASAMDRLLRTLREKEDALALKDRYISMMPVSLWVVDGKKNLVRDINPAFTSLLGYEREDILGFPVFDFMDEKSERWLRKQTCLPDSGTSSLCQLTLISKQGEMVPLTASWSALPADKDGTPVMLGILKPWMPGCQAGAGMPGNSV